MNVPLWILSSAFFLCSFLPQKSLDDLNTQNRTEKLSYEQLEKWDRLFYSYCIQKNVSFSDRIKVASYLYTAQKKALDLCRLSNRNPCLLDPISLGILLLFFPDFPFPQTFVSDPYSQSVASYLIPYFEKRLNQQESVWNLQCESFVPKSRLGKAKTKKLLRYQKIRTTHNVLEALFWQHHQDWYFLANDPTNHPCEIVTTKMLVAQAMYDAYFLSHRDKQRFQKPRPYEEEPLLKPICTSSYYRYPSCHTSVCEAAKCILQRRTRLKLKASYWTEKSLYSRWYTGLDDSVDLKAGKKLGRQLSSAYLNKWAAQKHQENRTRPLYPLCCGY